MSDSSLSGTVGNFITNFERVYPPAQAPASGEAIYLPLLQREPVLQKTEGGGHRLIVGDYGRTSERIARSIPGVTPSIADEPLYLGTLDGVPCLAFEAVEGPADNDAVAPTFERVGLRALYGQVSEAEYGLVGYASQILRFRRESRFCPIDGTATVSEPNGWGRKCPECGHIFYPPVSPAVLILVHDGGDRILLATKPDWGKRYSILAGFVEPGETLEECCWREALEEAGVQTTDFQYMGSQPWPFPHQLMVGFFCRHAAGDIQIDETELARADWFHYDSLPELPPPLSLSRQLIDRWVATRK